jgi:heme exporter protein D
MNTTSMISLAVLVVLVILYVGRRRARLRREDLE